MTMVGILYLSAFSIAKAEGTFDITQTTLASKLPSSMESSIAWRLDPLPETRKAKFIDMQKLYHPKVNFVVNFDDKYMQGGMPITNAEMTND